MTPSTQWFNNLECNWDDGDCCGATCGAVDRDFQCGGNGYHCHDPAYANQPTA